MRATSLLAVALVAVVASATACGTGDGVQTVHVTIRHSSFDPASFAFPPGATVRFVVTNADPIDHEFIIGDRAVQGAHEAGTEAHHPPRPGEMTVPAGTRRTTTYTFARPGALIFGCHLPGHYAYGMHGPIRIG